MEDNEFREQVLMVLNDIRSDIDYENVDLLVTSGIFDSIDIVQTILAINSEFDIELDIGDLIPDNLDNLDNIILTIKNKMLE